MQQAHWILATALLWAVVSCDVDPIERETLVSLYISTNGGHWENKWNWLQGDPCQDDWWGVRCSDFHADHVFGLDLRSNNLTGDLPVYLFQRLGYATRIALDDNNITGMLPLFNETLEEIGLSNNRMTGPIQWTSMRDPHLIDLANNSFTGDLRKTFWTSHLKEVDVSGNKLSGVLPDEIDYAENIQSLFLQNNRFGGKMPYFFYHQPVVMDPWVDFDARNNYFVCPLPNFCDPVHGDGSCAPCYNVTNPQ